MCTTGKNSRSGLLGRRSGQLNSGDAGRVRGSFAAGLLTWWPSPLEHLPGEQGPLDRLCEGPSGSQSLGQCTFLGLLAGRPSVHSSPRHRLAQAPQGHGHGSCSACSLTCLVLFVLAALPCPALPWLASCPAPHWEWQLGARRTELPGQNSPLCRHAAPAFSLLLSQ